MGSCIDCRKKPEITCDTCFSLIDGVVLQRRLEKTRKIHLETDKGKFLSGELIVVSPVGLGIKIETEVSDFYLINFDENLKIKVKEIKNRGKNNFHGFDIIEVIRTSQSSKRLNNEEYKALTASSEQLVAEIIDLLPENIKPIFKQRIYDGLQITQLMDALQVAQAFKYQNGNFKKISNSTSFKVPEKILNDIAHKCSVTGTPNREVIIDEDQNYYDVHGIPYDYQSGGILVLNATDIVKRERELQEKELQIYKDVLEAVTGGKLLLIKHEEVQTFMALGELAFEMQILSPEHLEIARSKVKLLCEEKGVSEQKSFPFLVCLSEALTNALKHANGARCNVNIIDSGLRIQISDNGTGISFKNLPKATLMNNYSTTNSLGCGFTIMLKYLDRLILATDTTGTTLILEQLNLF